MQTVIEWMIRHPVAANLLMIFMLFTGVISAYTVKTETFPEATVDLIEVSVDYLGAAPLEIEDSIIRRIEEQVQGIDGIDTVTSIANENKAIVRLELMRGQDTSKKLDEVRTAIDQITSFPEEAEEPQIQEIPRRLRTLQLAIFGNIPEASLKELAYRVKDELIALPDISYIEISGVRDYEVSIEVSRDTLRAYGLTLPEISAIIKQESLDLPGGEIKTEEANILLRTLGRNYYQTDFEDIVVSSNENGARVKLQQLAKIVDGFVDNDLISRYNGKPVVMVNVYRVGDEPLLGVVDSATDYIENTLRTQLPANVDVKIWRNDAEEFISRTDTLRKSGIIAIILVVSLLTLFLNTKVAFWVSAGIGITFLSAFSLLQFTGISLNSVSSFGLLLAIGIVVDDAIVIGENIYASSQKGFAGYDAAVIGAKRVSTPVIFAVATTLAAFTPLIFLPGPMGMIMDDIPLMVIIVLVMSLVEALLILPHHLATSLNQTVEASSNFLTRAQARIDHKLNFFIEGSLANMLDYVTTHYWVTICAGVAALIIGLGVSLGGYVKFEFFPSIDGRYLTATIEMHEGVPANQTLQVAEFIEQKAVELNKRVSDGIEGDDIVSASYVLVGSSEPVGGPQANLASDKSTRSHLANVVLELIPPETRDITITEFEEEWRNLVGEIPGARRIQFSASLINFVDSVGIEISAGSDHELSYALNELKKALTELTGVSDIRDDSSSGKTELKLTLRPEARNYGVTLQNLALQIRAAFFGAESLRVQRGREEVRVYVRLPKNERNTIDDLGNYWIRTVNGDFIPLWEVAEIQPGLSPSTINRRNGKRIVTVTADTDSSIITGGEVTAYLQEKVLPGLLQNTSTVEIALAGENRELGELAPALLRNLLLGIFAIYVLLAIPFRSYIQPLIVMSAIPFACLGALFGHYIMGFNLSIVSLFGIIGLSGVVINGALVLLDFANEGIAEGKDVQHALIDAAKSRFRPILLTSMTTFVGVSPILFDTSTNGRFLVPIAISLGFGVLVGVSILIFMVPALTMGIEDLRNKLLGGHDLPNRA